MGSAGVTAGPGGGQPRAPSSTDPASTAAAAAAAAVCFAASRLQTPFPRPVVPLVS